MKYLLPIFGIGCFLIFFIYGTEGISSFSANILSTQGGREEVIDLDVSRTRVVTPNIQKTSVSKINNILPKKATSCALSTSDVPTRNSILLNEVAWMGSESDAKKEWIELKNISTSTILIRGWEVRDATANIDVRIERASLSSGEFLVLRRGIDFTGTINNSDESLSLFDTKCTLVDLVVAGSSWPAGDSKSERTAERGADLSWHSSLEAGGTPGRENDKGQISNDKKGGGTTEQTTNNKQATSTEENNKEQTTNNVQLTTNAQSLQPTTNAQVGEVRISEVMTGKKGNVNFDFIELYNNSDTPVILSGWSIKKKSSTGNESTLVSASRLEGKTIPPHAYFLLAGGGYSGSPTPDVVWPNSYSLSGSSNGVILYMKSTPVDAVTWDKINENESIVREEWSASSYRREVSPTPKNTQL